MFKIREWAIRCKQLHLCMSWFAALGGVKDMSRVLELRLLLVAGED
jgi:hypothetical protein